MKFHLQRKHIQNCITLDISEQVAKADSVALASKITMVTVDAGEYHEPCMSLSMDEAQQLMDELWLVGLRPSEGTGSAGALAATQKHLDDMRKIAFDQLAIQYKT